MSITDVSNLIVIIGVIMAPIGFFSFFARLKNEMKRDSKESFETAAQLQNSMNSMMATFVMALMRGGINQVPQIRTNNHNIHSHSDSDYEEWSLYEEDDREFHYQLPSPSPVLGNKVKKKRSSTGSGFLVGLLSGISVFLLLALITVLQVATF